MVQVEDAQAHRVPGRISADGLTLDAPTAAPRLALAAKYTRRRGRPGRRTAAARPGTPPSPRASPSERFIGYFKPENRSTVGTGMIVSFDFNREIEDRAAVERAIRVTAEPPVEVAGHWFGERAPRLPPERRTGSRAPGSPSTCGCATSRAAPGVYGIQHKTVAFTVGRSPGLAWSTRRRTPWRYGATASCSPRVPITAGAPKTTTYNGKMVVTEMLEVTRMNGATVGFERTAGEYDIKDVPHAMRLTASGTFLHGNYWAAPDTFGTANVSHGCVGLRDVKGGSCGHPGGLVLRPHARSATWSRSSTARTRRSLRTTGSAAGTWAGRQWKAGAALN